MTPMKKSKPKVAAKAKPKAALKAKPKAKVVAKPKAAAKPAPQPKGKAAKGKAGQAPPAAARDWREVLAPFFEKRCMMRVGRGEKTATVFVFDAEKRAAQVGTLVANGIGDQEADGKALVMFATETAEAEPFKMVEALYFYDRATGETYFYEGGSYDPLSEGAGKPPLRLDQLKLKPA
jgi:hypothetical protein